MTEPTREPPADDTVDDERSDEDRGISDVGLPHPGDDEAAGPDEEATTAALDEAFPPKDTGGA